jgi:formate/nitrite transporter FocA (FNT family)
MAISLRRKARNSPPAEGGEAVQTNLERPSAEQIFTQVARNAKQELERTTLALAFSGFAGGIGMGLTGLGVAIPLAILGDGGGARFIANLWYPLGFIAVIVGRSQLFTENTLYPVALVLSERRHLGQTIRLWSTVLPANIAGALVFALLAGRSGGLRPEFVAALAQLGVNAVQPAAAHIFWSAVFGGWIIAMMAWMVSASHSVTGSVALIWMLAFIVGLGGFAHCIATSSEILTAVVTGQLPAARYFAWLGPALLGNISGGVFMVTLLEYGQVKQ